MTLREVIRLRQHKNDTSKMTTHTDFWSGYYEGWIWAYKDLTEILEQHGFDLDAVVIKEDA